LILFINHSTHHHIPPCLSQPTIMSNSIPTIVCALHASASAPLALAKPEEHPSQPIGRDGTEGQRTGEHPQPKISLNLTKDEINEDLFLMKSVLPPNHPQQQRPVAVQKMLNVRSPSLSLFLSPFYTFLFSYFIYLLGIHRIV
jgi:hypothetical protein